MKQRNQSDLAFKSCINLEFINERNYDNLWERYRYIKAIHIYINKKKQDKNLRAMFFTNF